MRASRFIPHRRGFTLVELMVVVAIIGVLATVAILNFMKFQARSKQSEAKSNLKGLFMSQSSYLQEKDRYSELAGVIGFAPERGNRYFYVLADAAPEGSNAVPQDRSGVDIPAGANHQILVDTFKYPFQPDGRTGTVSNPAMTVETGMPNDGTIGLYSAGENDSVSHFVASAVGNIDNDVVDGAGYDQWFISSESVGPVTPADCNATEEDERSAIAGSPYNMNNDVECP